MIADFDDVCLWMYITIDELWHQVAPFFSRPGPTPDWSDSELITMTIVGACRGRDVETELVTYWHERHDLFPTVPERSRFNRRRRNLMHAINTIRALVVWVLDGAQGRSCTIDSLPIPAVQFHLVPGASREWAARDANFSKVITKKQTIFGYTLHLLMTLGSVILDFILAPAHQTDVLVGEELLLEHRDHIVLSDKGYISAELASRVAARNGIVLLTIPCHNQKRQLPPLVARGLNARRQIVEAVNGQLTEHLGIATHHAHSFWVVCARLCTKLAAHTVSTCLSRLLGKTTFLQIKQLAFLI